MVRQTSQPRHGKGRRLAAASCLNLGMEPQFALPTFGCCPTLKGCRTLWSGVGLHRDSTKRVILSRRFLGNFHALGTAGLDAANELAATVFRKYAATNHSSCLTGSPDNSKTGWRLPRSSRHV